MDTLIEIGLIAYNFIGNKNTHLVADIVNVDMRTGLVNLPCKADLVEAITYPKIEDWNYTSNTKNYGDTSKIIDILTKEYGVIGVIAKGCKSLKSNLRSVTDKSTYATFTIYFKKDKLSILSEANVINNFSNKLVVDNAIMDLSEREKYILDQRYVVGKTQMEVAEELNISQAQVSRIEKKTVKELKNFKLLKTGLVPDRLIFSDYLCPAKTLKALNWRKS